jgi:hypothetical protein
VFLLLGTVCPVCQKTVTGKYGGFNSTGASSGETCRLSVCSSNQTRYLLLGFYHAPRLAPVTIQGGHCSEINEQEQPILRSCHSDNKPCLTTVQNSCACVRFTTPTCSPVEDLQGKYVAFNANYLKAIQYTTALQEAISIAKVLTNNYQLTLTDKF